MFSDLNLLPPDPIYGMQALYKQDVRPNKVNLSIGVCLDESGKILRFSAIDKAIELQIQQKSSKEYLPITGLQEYCALAQDLVLGKDRDNVFSMQSVGGTGAIYLAAKLLKRTKIANVFVPEPSWANHKPLFEAAGHKVHSYPYYDKERISLDFSALIGAISKMPANSAIILQASCHNPTGIDPDGLQWKQLSALIKKQNILPIFDLAYLGFGDGLSDDARSIQTFLADGHEMLIATSFSKSFGLYNDRIGLLTVASTKQPLEPLSSHLKAIARSCYSSPPANGALLIKTLLQDSKLTTLWKQELEACRQRLKLQRQMLYDALKARNVPFRYEHLLHTKGLFCLFDIPSGDIALLREKRGVYLALDGRISLAAITQENVSIVAEALAKFP
jgi:aspartate aminotransferase